MMMLRSSRFRSPSPRLGLLLAAVALALLPTATAAAQDLPQVRVTRAETIRAMRYSNNAIWRLTRAETGSVYDFILVDGDKLRHDESNWYLVVLPRDAFGTAWLGWISGRNVEPVPPRPATSSTRPTAEIAAATAPPASDAPTAAPAPAAAAARTVDAPAAPRAPAAAASTANPIPDVVLRFAFDRSELSEAAKHTLTTTLATTGAETGNLSFSLGGHADATGPDDYNQKLGLARADAVRKYIVEALNVPAARVSVSSYGETQPAAPNTTRAGRAENRRVVVTVTAAAPMASR